MGRPTELPPPPGAPSELAPPFFETLGPPLPEAAGDGFEMAMMSVPDFFELG